MLLPKKYLLYFFALILFFAKPALAQAPNPNFFDNYDNGKAKAGVQQVGCADFEFGTPAYRGAAAFKTWTTNVACPDTNRSYPSYNISQSLPALVTFWIKVDAASWSKAVGSRFSPLTIKEDPAQGVECKTRTLTTHIYPDGTMDIGHSIMSFRSTSVKAPLNQWHLESAYLETKSDGETHVTIWIDGKVAVEGTTNNPFIEGGQGVIHDLHMGIYGGSNDITMLYNDEIKVFSGLTGGISQAANLISQELGGGTVETKGSGASSPGNLPDCMDGKDNDADKLIDYPQDGGCDCRIDGDEGIRPKAECDDGIDNDNDAKVDLSDGGCTGVNDEVEQSSPGTNYPTVDFTANPNEIVKGGSTSLSWSTKNTSSCNASGGWSGSKPLNGSQSVAPSQTTNYILACTGSGGYRSRLATVYVGSGSTPPPSTPTPTKKPTSTNTPTIGATKTLTPTPSFPGDLDKDGDVDIFDYNLLANNFGNTSCGNIADIDGNCKVDIFDYNILVEDFGKTQ